MRVCIGHSGLSETGMGLKDKDINPWGSSLTIPLYRIPTVPPPAEGVTPGEAHLIREAYTSMIYCRAFCTNSNMPIHVICQVIL